MEQFIQGIISYAVPATVLLGILIFVHELGHFIVAKLCGIRVLKFSLGFGPTLIGKKMGETEYVISLLPLGGYVKPLGESPEEPVSEEDKPFSLNHQSIPRRFAVLAAGSFFNILFAALIFTFVYMIGIPGLTARVGSVVEGSPADKAGIREGDLITAINGAPVELWDDLSRHVKSSKGGELLIEISRNGSVLSTSLIPEISDDKNIFGEDVKSFKIGVMSSASEDAVITVRYPPHIALWKGFADTVKWSKLTLMGLGIMAKSPVERRKDIGGPILIGKLAGDFAKVGLLSFVMLMAMISVNLGVLNLLPIPILDGGHIFFLIIEAIKGSPVSMKKMEIAQQIGLAVLLLIMALVFYNDITRFYPG